jgi:hypothetical protein
MHFFQVIAVIAFVGPHFTMVNFEHPIYQGAEEVTVVTDQHYGAGETLESVQENLP